MSHIPFVSYLVFALPTKVYIGDLEMLTIFKTLWMGKFLLKCGYNFMNLIKDSKSKNKITDGLVCCGALNHETNFSLDFYL